MSALYAGLTVFVLMAAGAMALYVAIYGSNRPFDERISDLGVKMRVAYGNPLGLDVESDTFARSLFRWVAKRLPEPPISSKEGGRLPLSSPPVFSAQPRAAIFRYQPRR